MFHHERPLRFRAWRTARVGQKGTERYANPRRSGEQRSPTVTKRADCTPSKWREPPGSPCPSTHENPIAVLGTTHATRERSESHGGVVREAGCAGPGWPCRPPVATRAEAFEVISTTSPELLGHYRPGVERVGDTDTRRVLRNAVEERRRGSGWINELLRLFPINHHRHDVVLGSAFGTDAADSFPVSENDQPVC